MKRHLVKFIQLPSILGEITKVHVFLLKHIKRIHTCFYYLLFYVFILVTLLDFSSIRRKNILLHKQKKLEERIQVFFIFCHISFLGE